MKTILSFAFTLISVSAQCCGWFPMDDNYFFYNLFNQTNISTEAYYPFLMDNSNYFYQTDETKEFHKGNLHEWKLLLQNWSKQEIDSAVYGSSDYFNQTILPSKKGKTDRSALSYLKYARKCSDIFSYRQLASWEYDKILKNKPVDADALIEEGSALFYKETNPQLKLRYAYQLIRVFHYCSKYDDAIEFFNKNIESKFAKNETYYYALDQLAGCYYSLNNYEQAAYLFLQAFVHSTDRKASAFISYRFCNEKGAEGKEYFQNAADEAGYATIKGLRIPGNDMQVLKEVYAITPNDAQVELLFMRALNKVERDIWPTRIGMQSKSLPALKDDGMYANIKELYDFTQTAYQNNSITNKDFWLLASSYLSFCNNDLNEATTTLARVNNKAFSEQKNILEHVYEVLSWESVTTDNEHYLASFLQNEISNAPVSSWDVMDPAWKYLIIDHVAHLYYNHGALAKAFLMHNHIESVKDISSLSLIEDLESFVNKSNKNSFEKLLTKRSEEIEGGFRASDYLRFVKGLYYLQHKDPKLAYSFLKGNPLNEGHNELSDLVPATIFSNNIMECFTECDEDVVMEDLVYKASLFSFIQPTFTKADLASNLIELDNMSKSNPLQWKRKLAYYLLGNYYFNVSNTGYFRGTFTGHSNCCNYHYMVNNEHTADQLINDHKGYNLYGIDGYYKTYYGLAQKSYEYYESVIANSTDDELNARCLYMMAKCELNEMYNTVDNLGKNGYSGWSNYYSGVVNNKTIPYKKSLKRLKEKYADTKFYDRIIQECSFFKYYCSL